VTCVAKLRDDMTAAVIHKRLYDWGYDDIDANGIKQSFVVDPDVRPSKERDGAYEINPAAGQRITDEFGPAKLSIAGWQARFLRVPVLLSFVCLTVVATVGTYHLATQRQGPRDLSWDEFRTRSGFDKKSTTSPIRAKFFLFYITEYVRLRYDMEPAVVSDRLSDLGFTNSLPDEIKAAFDKDTDIIVSDQRPGAYRINPRSVPKFNVLLDIQKPTKEHLTLAWLGRHVPVSAWIVVATAIVAVASAAFGIGTLMGFLRGRS